MGHWAKKERILSAITLGVILGIGSCKTRPPTATSGPEASTERDSLEIKVLSDTIIVDSTAVDTVQKQVYPVFPDTLIVEQIVQDTVEKDVYRVFPDTISIIGVGDIMLGTDYPEDKYLPPDSGRQLLTAVAPILQAADLTFGNLEGVLLNSVGTPKTCKNPEICYLFRSPTYMAGLLKAAGFDLLSVANNHSGDFGPEGRSSTAKTLDSLGIHYAGFESLPFTTFRHGHMIYGFAAFAPNKETPSISDIDSAVRSIQHLDSISDIVIVSFHGGAEGKDHQNVTRKSEFFYGENRGNVYDFSHKLIDAGADILFGHGPHVPRAVEVYKERFIAYSLGNFCTYKRFNLREESAYAPIVKVFVDSQGKFYRGQIISAIQKGLGVPVPDPFQRAFKRIRDLTLMDFEEGEIVFDDNGAINYIEK